MAKWTCDEYVSEIHAYTGELTDVNINGTNDDETIHVSMDGQEIAIAPGWYTPPFLAAHIKNHRKQARRTLLNLFPKD